MTPRDVSNTAMTFEVKDWLKPQSHLSHRIVESLFYNMNCKTIQFPSLVLDKKEQNEHKKKWILWGLSLRSLSHMLAAGGKERCDWPLCNVDSPVLCWTLLYPYMGFVELTRRRHHRRTTNRHVVAFAGFVSVVGSIVILFTYIFWMMTWALLFQTGRWEEPNKKPSMEDNQEKWKQLNERYQGKGKWSD